MKVLQFPRQGSTNAIRFRGIPENWAEPISSGGGFLNSWFPDDFEPNDVGVNWGAVSGLVLSLAFSAVFWAGVGLVVERILR